MASSRTRPTKADPLEGELLAAVQSALAAALDSLSEARAKSAEPLRRLPVRRADEPIVLALSGGRDSMVLLDLLHRLATVRGSKLRRLHAVHVHHGLNSAADAWLEHCERQCQARGIALVARRVEVQPRGRGIEAAARAVRYSALADAARQLDARIVLTAHHRDDRLETFLLQWMRGAGVDGLSAFPPNRAFEVELRLVRPLIDIARADIERYVERRAIEYVEDDSNDDRTLLRNAVRADILPRLESLRPGFRAAAARSIDLVAEAADALHSVAQADLAAVADGAPAGMLWLDRLLALPASRAGGALRTWLAAAGLAAPSRARLLELLRQARVARSDARLLVRIGDREVRRYRGLLLLKQAEPATGDVHAFRWHGQDEEPLSAWGGTLRFVATQDEGFDPDWLRSGPLEVRPRGGGERFKPHAGRPSKTLKRLFQDAGIPEFERAQLPLLWRGDELIYVAGLGSDVRRVERDGVRIAVEWQPDARLLEAEG
jgi:tRNA(Ile)-lysidine synthase